jgi:hypothetical protein
LGPLDPTASERGHTFPLSRPKIDFFSIGYGWNRGVIRIPADNAMLWTLFVLLLLAWLICVLMGFAGVISIHLLLVLAVIVLLARLLGGTSAK